MTRCSGSFSQLAEYMLRDKAVKKEQGIPVYVKHLLKGNTIESWVKQLQYNESLRQNVRVKNVKMYHEILSLSPKDKEVLTSAILEQIAREYIKERAQNSMVLAVAHEEAQKHTHLHFLISGLEYHTGRSNRISRERFMEIKLHMEAYQKQHFPQIQHSSITHNLPSKRLETDKEHQVSKRGVTSQKEALKAQLEQLLKESKSKDEFYQKINETGTLKTYIRGDKVYGLTQENGRNIRFKTIGFDEKIQGLEKVEERTSEMKSLRAGKSEQKEMEKETSHKSRLEQMENTKNYVYTDDEVLGVDEIEMEGMEGEDKGMELL